MIAGGAVSLPILAAGRPRAFARLRMLRARVSLRLMAWRSTLISGGWLTRTSPVGVISSAASHRRVRLGALARRDSPPIETVERPLNHHEQTNITGSIVSARRGDSCRFSAQADHVDRAPLLRFCSLQHMRPRCAIRGSHASGRSRFGARGSRPAPCGRFVNASRPCGFPPCGSNAVSLDAADDE